MIKLMKNKFISLLLLVINSSLSFAVVFPFGMWLVTNELKLPNVIEAAKLGSYLGAYCGFGIWFLYRGYLEILTRSGNCPRLYTGGFSPGPI